MKYFSTRNANLAADGPQAVLKGIAPDGGLYTPVDFSQMHMDIEKTLHMSAVEISAEVIGKILPDFTKAEMQALVESAYAGKFASEELTPVVSVGNDYVLELFHGPTSAFKDVALSVLPRLIVASREKLGVEDEVCILTATSGDTGKAALEGFADVPGTRIVVFYPDGGVSDVQKAQMVTTEGKNVRVCAIKGNFDDAQTGVKNIFADDEENHWAKAMGARLSSANSINIGRLAPQVAYYFKTYADLVKRGAIAMGEEINFVVPTGNFGDILAGEFARRMGLPVAKLVCASNANNVLTDFIRDGVYDRRRLFYKTISPSMDILVSSNLERYLLLLTDGDFDFVAARMEDLKKDGCYTIGTELTEKMHTVFDAYCADDAMAKEATAKVYTQCGYLLDPHTATAWSALEQMRRDNDNGKVSVVLATASPYKFAKAVLDALGEEVPEDGFDAIDALHARTNVPVPKNLSSLRGKKARFSEVIDKDAMCDAVKAALEG